MGKTRGNRNKTNSSRKSRIYGGADKLSKLLKQNKAKDTTTVVRIKKNLNKLNKIVDNAIDTTKKIKKESSNNDTDIVNIKIHKLDKELTHELEEMSKTADTLLKSSKDDASKINKITPDKDIVNLINNANSSEMPKIIDILEEEFKEAYKERIDTLNKIFKIMNHFKFVSSEKSTSVNEDCIDSVKEEFQDVIKELDDAKKSIIKNNDIINGGAEDIVQVVANPQQAASWLVKIRNSNAILVIFLVTMEHLLMLCGAWFPLGIVLGSYVVYSTIDYISKSIYYLLYPKKPILVIQYH